MSCGCNSGSGPILIGQGGVQVLGSGTASDPYLVSQDTGGSTLQLEVRDSSTVNMTVFGSGTRTDPYIIRADTSSASSLRSLGDVAPTPAVTQGAVPQWIGSTVGGHFEFRTPGVRYTTNATRGFGLYQGEVIRETDTQKRFEWDGSQWVDLSPAYVPPSALDPSVVANAGTLDPSTDWNSLIAKSGIYRVSTYASNVNGPAGAYNYGTLLVVIAGSSVTQNYFEHGSGYQWWRTKFNAADWTAWQRAYTTADASTSIGTLTSRLSAEINDRQSADNAISQRLSNEINDRTTQDNNLQNNINGRAPYAYVDTLRQDATNADNDIRNRLANLEAYGTPGLTYNGDWSANRINFWRAGRVVMMDISFTRRGTTIGSGNITNIQVATITGGFGSAGFAGLTNGPGGSVASGYVNGTGIFLSATTDTIANGQELTLCGTWIIS